MTEDIYWFLFEDVDEEFGIDIWADVSDSQRSEG